MARVRQVSRESENGAIRVLLEMSQEELKLIGARENVLVVPKDDDFLTIELTTGRIGHGNRIMVPNRLLNKHQVKLLKKVPARLFEVRGEKYLLIRLKKSDIIPEFEE
jgi:RNase P/RNase MRP subunit p29